MDLLERFLSAGEDASSSKLVVRLTPEKTCFVAVPPNLTNQWIAAHRLPLALRLKETTPPGWGRGDAGSWHVAWAGTSSSSRGILEVPAALARCMELEEGITVSILPLPQVPDAQALSVEPASEDDWELVEIHAEYMEEQLLNQVGIIAVGQPFPFWVGRHTPLYLKPATAEPAALVKLTRGLELSVAPRPRKRAHQNVLGVTGNIDQAPSAVEVSWLRLQMKEERELLQLRIDSGRTASSSGQEVTWQTSDTTSVYLSPDTAQACSLQNGQMVAVAASPSSRKLVAQLRITESTARVHAMLPAQLLGSVQLSEHRAVAVWQAHQFGLPPERLVLHPIEGSAPGSVEALTIERDAGRLQGLLAAWVEAQAGQRTDEQLDRSSSEALPNGLGQQDNRGVPIQDGSVIDLKTDGNEAVCLFVEQRSGPRDAPKLGVPFLLQPEQVASGQIKIELGEPVDIPLFDSRLGTAAHPKEAPLISCFGENWMQAHLLPCLHRVLPLLHHGGREAWWKLQAPTPGGLLVCGPAGSGKTALISLLGRLLAQHSDCQTHIVNVDCCTIETDTLTSAKDQLDAKMQEAVDCLPTLLVLDNLHLLCPAHSETPETVASTGTAALTQWLCNVLDFFREQRDGRPPLPVVVCATSPTAAELAEQLRAPGRLDHTVTLQPPGRPERHSLLATALSAKHIAFESKQLEALATKADGFDAADLQVFVDRAVHAAVKRQITDLGGSSGEPLVVHQEDLDCAWEGFYPAASWGVGRAQGSSLVSGWEDVGGMHDVRDALQEALELPMKFAKLLARAPLRLRTGVLLYGPPGCGKTHVVAAAVAASGVRFLSVKGPELLNKYIGASEAAVRDVFRQASAAAPCVLFFDEFDAIAPQRGHDSTGVTDRVVNQLLTELDGVEGLKGVVVLAATSRPDLLDAALLRPGRLDRLIYCGLPDRVDRLAILRALSRKLPLTPEVELPLLAAHTDHFTGADLGSLLADAQLAAVHELLDRKDTTSKVAGPQISAKHIDLALKSARMSLSGPERSRLGAIYRKFRGSRQAGVGDKDDKGKGLRATLA